MLVAALLLLALAPAFAEPLDDVADALCYREHARALQILQAETARGNAAAARQLAELYHLGRGGVPMDRRKAVELWRKADAAGDALAAERLQKAVRYGMGTPADQDAARKMVPRMESLLVACADRGDLDCMAELEDGYGRGWDLELDQGKAVGWAEKRQAALTKKAETGEPCAQTALARFLGTARPPIQDLEAGRLWARRAADQGYAPGMTTLGDLIRDEHDSNMASPEALEWYRKAAESGDPTAYRRAVHGPGGYQGPEAAEALKKAGESDIWVADELRRMYEEGHGVPVDMRQALRWGHRAARSGHLYAQNFMGERYLKGSWVRENLPEAYKWFQLAAWQGDPTAPKSLKELEAKLDPYDLARAKKLVEGYHAEAYPVEKPLKRRRSGQPAAVAAAADEAPAAAARLPERPEDFALVVGIERYRGLPAADYAESDAAAVRERLGALGVPERNIISLIGADATRSRLEAYLAEWLPKNVTAKSRVFFYFSGHGSPDAKTGQAYLVPADGDPAFLKSTAYALRDVYAALERLPAARIVVGLDSCFSGAGGRSVIAKGVRPLVAKIDLGAPAGDDRLIVLAAAEGDQLSGGLAHEQQGAFTHFLLRGLAGGAQDPQGRITAGGLAAFIRPKVADAARRQNREQTPVLYGDPATVLFELK